MSNKLPKPAPLPAISQPRTSSLSIRLTHRPTVTLQSIEPTRVQEVILGIFRRFDYTAMDLESLIYFTLQNFRVTPESYEMMYKTIRTHIISNFAIHQGALKPPIDNSTRRLTVCYTIDKRQE